MLIAEILNELTLPQTPQDAGTLLKSAGYQPVGESGHWTKVWGKPGDPYVLKLFDPNDKGYLAFVNLGRHFDGYVSAGRQSDIYPSA